MKGISRKEKENQAGTKDLTSNGLGIHDSYLLSLFKGIEA
jgi:hypothetical protein